MSRDDKRSPDFDVQAAELDHLADVPTELLVNVVDRGGTCWWEVMTTDPLLVGQHHPRVGGPRGPGAIGRVHAG